MDRADIATALRKRYKADGETGPIIHCHGNPVKQIQTARESALARAGIKRRLRPYDMRHYFITKALEDGGISRRFPKSSAPGPKPS